MAERRMFAKSIVTSDAFLDMPTEAQALYFQLNMSADDDGFVDNPRSIMRICGASNDAMRILISKKFVLTFEKGDNFLIVIKHWRVNNYIRKDAYRETRYKALMRDLFLDENGSYSTNPGDGHTPLSQPCDESVTGVLQVCDGSVPTLSTQERIGKDSKGKDKESKDKDRLINDMPPADDSIESYNERLRYLVRKGDVGLAMSLYRLYQSDGFNTINPEDYANELKG